MELCETVSSCLINAQFPRVDNRDDRRIAFSDIIIG